MNQQKLNTAPDELETVSGIVDSIIYQNEENGYIVCELEDTEGHPVTVTGIIPYLAEGDKITCTYVRQGAEFPNEGIISATGFRYAEG